MMTNLYFNVTFGVITKVAGTLGKKVVRKIGDTLVEMGVDSKYVKNFFTEEFGGVSWDDSPGTGGSGNHGSRGTGSGSGSHGTGEIPGGGSGNHGSGGTGGTSGSHGTGEIPGGGSGNHGSGGTGSSSGSNGTGYIPGGGSPDYWNFIDAWELLSKKYGEKVASILQEFGEDGLKLAEKYGDDLARIIDNLEPTEAKKAVSLINSYGDDALEMFKEGKSFDEVKKIVEGEGKVISQADRAKIDAWNNTPSDELYLKYKDVFDNPKYYDQITGEIHWPIDDGFLEGTKNNQIIKKGTIFKRYGESSGEFLGNAIDSFESRALAPHSELAEIHYYRLKEDFEMTSGKVASWFGSGGGAEQFVKYKEDGSKYTIDELIKENKLEDITESVKDGRIEIE